MSIFEDFMMGLVKPLCDLLFSLFFYAISVVISSIQSTMSNLHSSSNWNNNFTTLDPLLFLAIFCVVSILSEVIMGIKMGFNRPFNAFSKILGIFFGICIFWGFLGISYSTIGSSPIEVIVSFIITCGCSVSGILLRCAMTNTDSYYDNYRY